MNSKSNTQAMETEKVPCLLAQLAIPAVVAQVINLLYNIVDRIYIGHIPGEGSLALTGVGVCMPIIMIVSAFAALVSSGGAPRASIYMGKQDNKSAENILGNCFILQIIISVILTAILLIWGRDLLLAFGASENTISYATDYMHIYAFGTLFVQLTLGMNAFITAQGFTTFSMVSVLIGAVCNIVLDPVFIFVFHMGVRGAALATVISQAISTLWVVLFLCGKKTQLHLRKKHLHLEAKVVLPCIALGLAAFIMQSSESIVTVCFNSSLLRYGGDIAVGAMTILTSVMQFAMLPMQGIGQGAQPIMSFNYGAGKIDRVKKAFRAALTVGAGVSVAAFALFQLFPREIISMFGDGTEEYFEFGVNFFRIFLFFTWLNCLQPIASTFFTSIGKSIKGAFLSLTRQIIFLLPPMIVLPLFMGIDGILWAGPFADLLSAAAAIILIAVEFRIMKRQAAEKGTA